MKPTLASLGETTDLSGFDTQHLRQNSTKVLIQETATRRYLATGGLWSPDIKSALTFRSGSAAMEQVTQRKLSRVHLVLTREYTVTEIIPVSVFTDY